VLHYEGVFNPRGLMSYFVISLISIYIYVVFFLLGDSPASYNSDAMRIKVKESRNRPGVAQRVPGRLGSQIS
jgi:hypothetical protein